MVNQLVGNKHTKQLRTKERPTSSARAYETPPEVVKMYILTTVDNIYIYPLSLS